MKQLQVQICQATEAIRLMMIQSAILITIGQDLVWHEQESIPAFRNFAPSLTDFVQYLTTLER
jgi:hypothetical protein